MFRICVAEADRIPELGRQFYENGPMMGRQHIAEYLRKAAGQAKSKSMTSNLPRINSRNCAKQLCGHRRFLEFAVNLTTMKNNECQRLSKLLSGICPEKISAPIFRRALLILVHHDAADTFARMHQIKPFVDVIKA